MKTKPVEIKCDCHCHFGESYPCGVEACPFEEGCKHCESKVSDWSNLRTFIYIDLGQDSDKTLEMMTFLKKFFIPKKELAEMLEEEKLPSSSELEEIYQLNEGNIDMDTIFNSTLGETFTRNQLRKELKEKLDL